MKKFVNKLVNTLKNILNNWLLNIIADLVYFSHYIKNEAGNKAASFTLLNCPLFLLYPIHARNKQQENDANGYGNLSVWIDEHEE